MSATTGQIVAVAVGSGMMSAAIVELLKQLSAGRFFYHKRRLRSWIRNRWYYLNRPDDKNHYLFLNRIQTLRKGRVASKRAGAQSDVEGYVAARFKEFIELSGGDEPAILGQPVAGLMHQVRMVAHVATSFPQQHPELAHLFTGIKANSILYVINKAKKDPDSLNSANAEKQRRVSVLVDSNIQSMKVSFGHWWELVLKVCATLLTLVIVSVLDVSLSMPVKLGVAFVGGMFLGPATKDLVSAVQTMRGT